MDYMTDFLFARPSFIEGMGCLFDFGNGLNAYNVSPTPVDADALAMWMDWAMTGQDLQFALTRFGKKESGFQ